MEIRMMEKRDVEIISQAFQNQGWHKPVEQYERYFVEQRENKRLVLVAYVNNEFAGYVTLVYDSNYPYFKEKNIMEIMDFNVLMKFQQQGIGTALMNEIERIVGLTHNIVGLRVGVIEGYGSAQNLYIKRGYTFDKKGISYNDKVCNYNDDVVVDDDLVLGMTKNLKDK